MNENGMWLALLPWLLLVSLLQDDDMEYVAATPIAVVNETPGETKPIVACPRCVYVPEGLQCLKEVKLLEGSSINLPTQAYLAHLEDNCNTIAHDYAHIECLRRLKEIRIGTSELYSRINPIYGRVIFTDNQLADIRFGSARVGELLDVLEYMATEDEGVHYLERNLPS